MRGILPSFSWLNNGWTSVLFWRTFLLLAILVSASMTAWFASYKLLERKPRAEQLAGKIAAIVTITRAALTYSAADKQRELLLDLADSEGIRIYLREESDRILTQEPSAFSTELRHLLQTKLGADTQFARSVNDEAGFWVSFTIENDQYWLSLDQDSLHGERGLQILGWASVSLIFTLIGAIFISRFINDPLARLSAAARMLAQGSRPEPLPESGPKEIRETNLSFNRMVADLAQVEKDRAVILAGISHDLRTPITRMQLEVELAGLDEAARSGMQSDLIQMDAIIHQFLDYAKPLNAANMTRFDVTALFKQTLDDFSRKHAHNDDGAINMVIDINIHEHLVMHGLEVEIRRLLTNLLENARRYGRDPDNNQLHLEVSCSQIKSNEDEDEIHFCLRDHGIGIADTELGRVMRPFARGDIARGQANGSGLGLSIVERIVRRHQGRMQLSRHAGGGLEISIYFAVNSKAESASNTLG